jgi:hypothetical protein
VSPSDLRPFTKARVPEAEQRAAEMLAALLSSLKDTAGETWFGAALGGALGAGEGATRLGDGSAEPADPFELLAIVKAPLRQVPALTRTMSRALEETARSRRVSARVRVVSREELALLPPTLANLELLASAHVVDGPPSLLGTAPVFRCDSVDPLEGLALLVRRGAALLAAERAVDRARDLADARQALAAVRDTDLALGTAVLLSARRFVAGDEARQTALRELAGGPGNPHRGFHTRMSWTRFRDLVDRHRLAVESRLSCGDPAPAGDARRQVARAADRWMEVLRLYEEDRLNVPLSSWTDYARSLAARRRKGATGSLFDADDATGGPTPTRRSAKTWPPAERLAPAIAALIDWDPGDLPIAPILLDMPSDAARDALRRRAIAWGEEV